METWTYRLRSLTTLETPPGERNVSRRQRSHHAFGHATGRVKGAALAAVLATLAGTQPSRAAPDAAADPVARGAYLVTAGDCAACHTAPGGQRFAGGRPLPTPYGTIFTPNITPDRDTGIGTWTDADFYHALHDGIGKNGEYLYPAFPFPSFTHVTKEDVAAIHAYLMTQPAVHAPRKPNQLEFPYDVRTALAGWRILYFRPGTFTPDPHLSAAENRGAYLVEGLGHCGACHTPRNMLGATEPTKTLSGAQVQGWFAPNITSNVTYGIGGWTDDQLVTFLREGHAPGKGVVLGPMEEVVRDSLSHLDDGDLHAIAAYLKSTPPKGPETVSLPSDFAGADKPGASAYLNHCAFCHGVNGAGVKGQIPALAGNGAIGAAGPEDVIRTVLGGHPATGSYGPMPAVGADLSDADIAAAINFARTAWQNPAPPNASAGEVAKLRAGTAAPLTGDHPTCPQTAPQDVATAVADSGVPARLRDIAPDHFEQEAADIAAQARQAAPKAGQADLVNALTDVYCHVLLDRADRPLAQRRLSLQWFGQIIYGRIANADGMSIGLK